MLVEIVKSTEEYLPTRKTGLLFPLPPSLLKPFWENVFSGFYDISIFSNERDLKESFKICIVTALQDLILPVFRATYSTSKQNRIGIRIAKVLQQFIQILDIPVLDIDWEKEKSQKQGIPNFSRH